MKMASALKTIVSKNKHRHVELISNKKYDLDLTYICDRIIAMGYPAEKLESMYRNDYNDVKDFLDQKHGNHYWVYNLCAEKDRTYDKKKFEDRCSHYPFDDHHPPVFKNIQPFCEEVKKYLEKDERNVAVVHCKAGKGRTGVMICCYLLHIGFCKNAEEVLKFYGEKRTADQKGVTIPSQRRYITYYDTIRRKSLEYKPVKLYLKDIVLDPMPNFTASSQYNIYFEVRQRSRERVYEYRLHPARKGDRNVCLNINPPLLLTEDTKFEFFTKAKYESHIFNANSRLQKWANNNNKGEKAFHFWLNTFFVDMEIEGCLAHDLTCSNPIVGSAATTSSSTSDQANAGSNSGPTHMHHASGSSEDSSAEDMPLRTSLPMTSTNGGSGHHHIGTNFQKQVSTSDDHLLRQTDGSCSSSQAPENVTIISSMGPLSSSSENNASSSNDSCFSSTTPESFRSRHVSMPQHSVRTQPPICDMTGSGHPQVGGHHHHHHPLEGRTLSHGLHQHHQQIPGGGHVGAVGNHATITSQTSMNSYTGSSTKFHIPGKQLSLRLKKAQIDKAHKDKTNKTFPDNFSVTLFLVKPPEDQSDSLIDYSLLPQAMMASSMNNHSTISTGTGYNPGGSVTAPAVCSGERQFTVTPVPSANPAGNSAASNETSAASLITGNGNNISDQVVHPAAHRPQQRSRPLTGESGASSSSATPSLKSMEQSSQDSAEEASSEDDTGSEVVDFYKVGVSGGENTTGNNSPSLKNSSNHQKHLKIRSTTTNNRANNTTSGGRTNVLPTVPQTAVSTNQQPQSTWI